MDQMMNEEDVRRIVREEIRRLLGQGLETRAVPVVSFTAPEPPCECGHSEVYHTESIGCAANVMDLRGTEISICACRSPHSRHYKAPVPVPASDCTCEHDPGMHGDMGCITKVNGGHNYCLCSSETGPRD